MLGKDTSNVTVWNLPFKSGFPGVNFKSFFGPFQMREWAWLAESLKAVNSLKRDHT